MTPEQFHADPKASSGKFNLLNVNIRSLSKNFDKLKECVKALNCDFNVIGISETHLKDKPNDYYNLPGFTIEYTNRNDREKGCGGFEGLYQIRSSTNLEQIYLKQIQALNLVLLKFKMGIRMWLLE